MIDILGFVDKIMSAISITKSASDLTEKDNQAEASDDSSKQKQEDIAKQRLESIQAERSDNAEDQESDQMQRKR